MNQNLDIIQRNPGPNCNVGSFHPRLCGLMKHQQVIHNWEAHLETMNVTDNGCNELDHFLVSTIA
jgi:hypothetical protein